MIIKIKNIFHFFIRCFPNVFGFIYALLFIFFVKTVSKKKNFERKVLMLNKDRFWDDLKELNKSEKLMFIYFDKRLISFLTEPYVKTIRHKMPSTFWRDYKNENFFKIYLDNHSKFIFYFLKYFDFFYKFDLIVTPSLWYLQDRSFEKGANLLKKKFIFLHKENTTDLSYYDKMLKVYDKNTVNFENSSSILVYNNNTKKIIADTKKIDSNRIYNLGCPRIDQLVNLKISKPETITLSSFTYKLGLWFIEKDVSHPFATTDPNLKLYFDNVHSMFIDLAAKNEKAKFVIKTKPNLMWKKIVKELINNKEKNLRRKIENLSIISDEYTMADILKESKLVVGINSLSLVEARIIGIPCVTPNFEEISDYKDKLFFQKYLGNEILQASNTKQLSAIIMDSLNNDFKKMFTKFNKDLTEEYFGYCDGKNNERYINFLLNI